MTEDQIVGSGLFERRAAVLPETVATSKTLWQRLREENAPFRIIRDGGLVSVPLTYFDAFLEHCATDEWQKAARLIGETMGRMMLDLQPPGQSPGDVVLFGRMLAMGEESRLDVEGSGREMRDYRVRRRSPAS